METDNLLQNVRNFFIEQYKDLAKTDSYLAFEPIGCVINPDEYKDPVTGIVNNARVNEDISELVDRVPEISDVYLPGLDKISSQYQMLVDSAQFDHKTVQGGDVTNYLALFGKLKNDAEKLLKDADKLSIVNLGGKFFPATTVPSEWYDLASPIWARKEFHLQDQPTAQQSAPANPIDQKMKFLWKGVDVNKLQPEAIQNVNPALKSSMNNPVFMNKMMNMQALKIAPALKATTVSNNPELTAHAPKMTMFAATPLTELHMATNTVKVSRPTSVVSDEPVQRVMAKELFLFDPKLKPTIATKAEFGRLMVHSDVVTETRSISSNNLSISFDYSIVQINRFWFDTKILDFSRLWYTLAQPAGFFSSGERTVENKGNLRAIPKAFILIKNLVIQASWSKSDLEAAKSSVGFGCFNLANSRLNQQNELSNPSLQIIGWLCEVLPKTPLVGVPILIK